MAGPSGLTFWGNPLTLGGAFRIMTVEHNPGPNPIAFKHPPEVVIVTVYRLTVQTQLLSCLSQARHHPKGAAALLQT